MHRFKLLNMYFFFHESIYNTKVLLGKISFAITTALYQHLNYIY